MVLQHMSINLMDEEALEEILKAESEVEVDNKENIDSSSAGSLAGSATATALSQTGNSLENGKFESKLAEKRKAQLPPFGLSPPSESKLIQRRSRQKSSQSLNLFSCRNSSKSTLTKNSSNHNYFVADLVSPCNYVESPGCWNETEINARQTKKTEEIFHLKNRKPIIIVIEKNNHAINKQHPGLFLYFRIRFQKPKAIQIFFFSKNPLEFISQFSFSTRLLFSIKLKSS